MDKITRVLDVNSINARVLFCYRHQCLITAKLSYLCMTVCLIYHIGHDVNILSYMDCSSKFNWIHRVEFAVLPFKDIKGGLEAPVVDSP